MCNADGRDNAPRQSRTYSLPENSVVISRSPVRIRAPARRDSTRATDLKAQFIVIAAIVAVACSLFPRDASAQAAGGLSLAEAKSLARVASPELTAAREALQAARGLELQAGAFANPQATYSTERTSAVGQSNRQQIFGIEQRIELGGQRRSRRQAAELRTQAAEARLQSSQTVVDFDVARAYALAVAADRRAVLARSAAASFADAGRVSGRRLAAGDVSGYSDRRLRLEAARYAALEAGANLDRRSARVTLSSLVTAQSDSIGFISAMLTDSLPAVVPQMTMMALQSAALRGRSEYRAASLDADALAAESRLAAAERIPTPAVFGGIKRELVAGTPESLNGFAAGLSIPLPLWDRRKGAMQAADALVRRANADREAVRRRIVREVVEAHDALVAATQQRAMLAPELGAQSSRALRSAQVAYAEGEITLLEWLDAVRAYHEAESVYSDLLAESLIRRANLERVIASPLSAIPLTEQQSTMMRSPPSSQPENEP